MGRGIFVNVLPSANLDTEKDTRHRAVEAFDRDRLPGRQWSEESSTRESNTRPNWSLPLRFDRANLRIDAVRAGLQPRP